MQGGRCWLRPHSPAGRGRRARNLPARCLRPSWKESHREEIRNRELEAARAKMLAMHDEQYERVLKAWARGQESSLLQEVVASWKESHREGIRKRELERRGLRCW